MTALASRLDELVAGGAHITESADVVITSNISTKHVADIYDLLLPLSWGFEVFDAAGTPWELEELEEAFEPFRILIRKPLLPDCVRVLTNTAFADWLNDGIEADVWQVALLNTSFSTRRIRFTSWDAHASSFAPDEGIKSARSVVREYGSIRKAPVDVGRWILTSEALTGIKDDSFRIWMQRASVELLWSIPDEVDAESAALKFKGPPRLTLLPPANPADFLHDLSDLGFWDLHRAVAWVFENERETELRHILLASEIARSGTDASATARFLNVNADAALEGAKIAYQASLSQVGGDTLKSLAELRKAVTDETAKVGDATRQITGAVATSLAAGVGLLAAKVTIAPGNLIIAGVMIVAVLYVMIVVVSGVQFALIQKTLRSNWQTRLYRFLSAHEYESLVTRPIERAEQTLWIVASLGVISVLVMTIVVLWHK